MSTIILPFKPISINSSMAWVRICFYLSKINTSIKLVTSDKSYINLCKSSYKNIIVPYNAKACYRNLDQFLQHNKNSNLFWPINEYDESFTGKNYFVNTFIERGFSVISNMPYESYKHKHLLQNLKQWHYLNLNTSAIRDYYQTNKKHYLTYWGRYREGRKKYFINYLNDKDVLLSTSLHKSKENIKSFNNLNLKCKYTDKLDFREPCNLVSQSLYTIYIEDEYTHNNYNSLSDRFYESVSLRCLPFFDKDCLNTIEHSKYVVDKDLIVNSIEEIKDKTKYINRDSILNSLLSQMNKEKTDVDTQLVNFINQYLI